MCSLPVALGPCAAHVAAFPRGTCKTIWNVAVLPVTVHSASVFVVHRAECRVSYRGLQFVLHHGLTSTSPARRSPTKHVRDSAPPHEPEQVCAVLCCCHGAATLRGPSVALGPGLGQKWNVGCEVMVSLNYRTRQICLSPRCLSRMWLPLLPMPTAAPSWGRLVNFLG